MKQKTKSRSHKNLSDLEPRKSNDDVRGGRLALTSSSVKFDLGSMGGSFLSYKVENTMPSFKENLGAYIKYDW